MTKCPKCGADIQALVSDRNKSELVSLFSHTLRIGNASGDSEYLCPSCKVAFDPKALDVLSVYALKGGKCNEVMVCKKCNLVAVGLGCMNTVCPQCRHVPLDGCTLWALLVTELAFGALACWAYANQRLILAGAAGLIFVLATLLLVPGLVFFLIDYLRYGGTGAQVSRTPGGTEDSGSAGAVAPAVSTPEDAAQSQERALWQKALQTDTPAGYREYLRRSTVKLFAAEAEEYLRTSHHAVRSGKKPKNKQ